MEAAGSAADQMQALEISLLHRDFSSAINELDRLLAPDFREVSAGGQIVSRQEVMDWILHKDPNARWAFSEQELFELAPDVWLFTYRARQVLPEPSGSKGARYCSVWKFNPQLNSWQLFFHQATRLG